MGFRRFLIVLLIAAILGTGITHPPPAHALDTAVIVVISIVLWFGVVILATWLLRHQDTGFSQSSVSPLLPDAHRYAPHPATPPRFRFGFACGANADGPSLVCW